MLRAFTRAHGKNLCNSAAFPPCCCPDLTGRIGVHDGNPEADAKIRDLTYVQPWRQLSRAHPLPEIVHISRNS
jgi:hypothetical protein